MSLLPPNPKKSKPDIDLTAEPDIAVEQPLPMVPPNRVPSRPPTVTYSATDIPGQLSGAQNVVNMLQCVRDVLQPLTSSRSITTQGYNASIINNDLARTPIKHHQQWPSGRDGMVRVTSRSKPHQSSPTTNATNRSFAPSMATSLQSQPNKVPSVPTSPPKRSSGHHSDIKRLPLNTSSWSLLADAYNLGGYHRSPTGLKHGQNSHDGADGSRYDCQKKPEPVVVIEEDEWNKSCLQTATGAEDLRCPERPQLEGALRKYIFLPSLYGCRLISTFANNLGIVAGWYTAETLAWSQSW